MSGLTMVECSHRLKQTGFANIKMVMIGKVW